MLYEELITKHLAEDRVVINDTKQEFHYSDLHCLVLKLTERFQEFGADAGQRVLIINHNSIYTVAAILTCIHEGLCFIIVSSESSESQISYILEDAEPCLMIDTREEFPKAMGWTGKSVKSIPEEKLIYIIYTSGSTGTPKGVMAPEKQVLFCIRSINEFLKNSPEDRILCLLPLSFDYGLYQLFFALVFEAVLILPQNFYLQEIPQLLKKYRITGFPSMPAVLTLLVRTDYLKRAGLTELRYITFPGGLFPVSLIRGIMAAVPNVEVLPMYGQTECKRVSVMPMGNKNKTLAGSCGLPLKGTKVWLDEPDETGVGELIVAGPNVMAGYLNADKVASQYYFEHPQYGRSLRTGDLFRIDDEGYLYFFNRKRRIIKVKGIRVGSLELETFFEERLKVPFRELRVLGIPDEYYGEKILMVISSDSGEEEIVADVQRISMTLPNYQQPRKLLVMKDSFPLSRNGKVDGDSLMRKAIEYGTLSL